MTDLWTYLWGSVVAKQRCFGILQGEQCLVTAAVQCSLADGVATPGGCMLRQVADITTVFQVRGIAVDIRVTSSQS